MVLLTPKICTNLVTYSLPVTWIPVEYISEKTKKCAMDGTWNPTVALFFVLIIVVIQKGFEVDGGYFL
jgi:hypothetical protein